MWCACDITRNTVRPPPGKRAAVSASDVIIIVQRAHLHSASTQRNTRETRWRHRTMKSRNRLPVIIPLIVPNVRVQNDGFCVRPEAAARAYRPPSSFRVSFPRDANYLIRRPPPPSFSQNGAIRKQNGGTDLRTLKNIPINHISSIIDYYYYYYLCRIIIDHSYTW